MLIPIGVLPNRFMKFRIFSFVFNGKSAEDILTTSITFNAQRSKPGEDKRNTWNETSKHKCE